MTQVLFQLDVGCDILHTIEGSDRNQACILAHVAFEVKPSRKGPVCKPFRDISPLNPHEPDFFGSETWEGRAGEVTRLCRKANLTGGGAACGGRVLSECY